MSQSQFYVFSYEVELEKFLINIGVFFLPFYELLKYIRYLEIYFKYTTDLSFYS